MDRSGLPEIKEPSYFASSISPLPRRQTGSTDDLERYQSIYKGADRFAAIGDASPFYLWYCDAPAKIKTASPSARIIIMLRDPVERAYSHYLMGVHYGAERRPFLNALREDHGRKKEGFSSTWHYSNHSLYHLQVRRYLETFGSEQVAIFLFEDLKRNPVDPFARIALHLGIESQFHNETELSRVENAFRTPRYPLLHELVRSVMRPEVTLKLLPDSTRAWLSHNKLIYDVKRPQQDRESREFLQGVLHAGYDRVVFQFGGGIPGYHAEYVTQVVHDASGKLVPLAGRAFLHLVFQPATAYQSYQGPATLRPDLPTLLQVSAAGDFEGHLSFGLGLSERAGFTIFTLTDPSRVVLDLAH